ncbi:hypothetical protein BgiMline_017612 [Biomphalaria glabrata]
MPFNYTPDVVMSSKDMCCYTSIATDPTLLCPVVTEMSLKSCKDICCYPPLHLFPTHHPPAQCPVGRLSQCVTNHVPTKSSKVIKVICVDLSKKKISDPRLTCRWELY